MSVDNWLDANNRYLSASLRWLRLMLDRFAGAPTFDPNELAQAAEARAIAGQCDPPPALAMLAARFGMSEFERDTLFLCVAVELDPTLAVPLSGAAADASHGRPTFALALQLFDAPTWDALSPHRPLRRFRLLDIERAGAAPLTAAALRADERIVHYAKGLNILDEQVGALVIPVANAERIPLCASQRAAADAVLRQLSAPTPPLPIVQLLGIDAECKLDVARACCAALGQDLYRIGITDLPSHHGEIDAFARVWRRESMLLPQALYVDAEDLDTAAADKVAALRTFAAREPGLVFVGVRELLAPPLPQTMFVDVQKPTAAEQRQAWLDGLRADTSADVAEIAAGELAGQFNLDLREIRATLADGGNTRGASERRTAIWNACRRLTQPRLDRLAERLEPKATWDDLVLSAEATASLHQITAQVRNRHRVYEDWGYARKMTRGLGIGALFTGESGTGKTMAAEVVANELQLSLYRIDLSAVVSKYIGETEKNLRRVFDAAERGGAILLFDEADALFGKRSEVKDSHDRYANIEINYLLQRMEAFAGLAILATNMKCALDSAFLRRLRFVVNFQFPGPEERKRMWQRALPQETPRDGLDFDRLARFNLSGGNIHSIALNAAFVAAARAAPVSQSLVLGAIRSELRKLDRPVHEGEFRA